jgi:molybdate transport system substrate-binding protein
VTRSWRIGTLRLRPPVRRASVFAPCTGHRTPPLLKPLGVADVVKAGASGEAELVVYVIPGILPDRGVELVGPLPAEIQSYVSLTAALSTAAKEPEAGKAFIAFLTSDAAMAVIKAKGWEPAAP